MNFFGLCFVIKIYRNHRFIYFIGGFIMSGKLIKTGPGSMLSSFFERLDNDFFNNFFENNREPSLNVTENDKEYKLELSVPGFSKEEIQVEANGHTLTVSASKENEKEEKDQEGKVLRREFSSSSFSRSFTLSDDIEPGNITANCKDGILCLTLPKSHRKPENKAKRIEIS